jgi:colanic acid/amylovoran biosynthesis glycosyltransferase
MKIAFVVSQFPALSETFILNQITGLIDRGHEVDIYACSPGNNREVDPNVEKYNLLNYTFYGFRMPRRKNLRVPKGLWLLVKSCLKAPSIPLRLASIAKYGKQAASLKLLYFSIPFLHKQFSYDIIHCHFGTNGLRASFLRNIGIFQGKLITTFHGNDITTTLQRKGDRYYNQLFSSADLFLPISERWKHKLIELGCDKRKIIVHRMGIDCKRFSFTSRQPQADGQTHLVTVARLVEKKGVEYGIRAVAKLSKVNRNIKYNIVGDGPLREDLQQLIQELDIGDRVKLLGWKQQKEVAEILNNADILLAPSVTSKDGDQEGIPVSVMEAMAMGLPIVSTQHSGIPELICNGISGFLVPERDVDALAEKLGYLIEHPEVWLEMGQAGRAQVEEYYNNDRLNDRLIEIYQDLITPRDRYNRYFILESTHSHCA